MIGGADKAVPRTAAVRAEVERRKPRLLAGWTGGPGRAHERHAGGPCRCHCRSRSRDGVDPPKGLALQSDTQPPDLPDRTAKGTDLIGWAAPTRRRDAPPNTGDRHGSTSD